MSSEEVQTSVSITGFPGTASNRSPHAAPTAPVTQTNMRSIKPGSLQVRKGNKPLTFTTDTDRSASIIAMFAHRRADDEFVLYEDSDGKVRVGKNPS